MNNYTLYNLYRQYFEEFYDFTDASFYGLNTNSFGVNITSMSPNIVVPNKNLVNVNTDGLNINGYEITFTPSVAATSTVCIVFKFWRNRSFRLNKYLTTNDSILISLNYIKSSEMLNLPVNKTTKNFFVPTDFNGKKVVLWLTENFNSNATKFSLSNYSSTITFNAGVYNVNQAWKFFTEDGVISKLMYSKNFYDIGSVQYHKVILQEKLNGTYIK